ncbi:MAG: hypothetical protein IJJ33_04650 [Victivallales bacterium]|nr:hypothetical protein [Victivallales bacterium]
MKTVNDYPGQTDNERIDAAIREREGGIVVIPERKSAIDPERTWWLLDRAILLPSNTTVILENCRIKLSDKCRDNFFRSANCGFGIEEPEPVEHIHIKGVGNCILEGADHPRATGDSSKVLACPCPKNYSGASNPTFEDLHRHSYGTDALAECESPNGDWRNIGILMARASHVSIENLCIIEPHAWAISFEDCSDGRVSHIEFKACMTRVIDGEKHNTENQDGINLRNGCHDFIISDITGTTGDDVIALSAFAPQFTRRKGGEYGSTHVLGNDWTKREKGIRNVIIRNVLAYPAGGCLMIRLNATDGAEIRHVVIDGIIDNSPDDYCFKNSRCSLQLGGSPGLLGDPNHPYGYQQEQSLFDISVSNVISNATNAIAINGGLQNSRIGNVITRNPCGQSVFILHPELLGCVVQTGVRCP